MRSSPAAAFDRVVEPLERPWRVPAAALLLFLVFLVILWPPRPGPNEEGYFAIAHHAVAPQDFPAHNAVLDRSRYGFLYSALAGYPMHWFGFEATQVGFRLLQTGLWAVAFAVLFVALELPLLPGLLALLLYQHYDARFMGQEWLFIGVEQKTFAYGFVLLAFAAALRGRWLWLALAAAVATYFHFQVGGFWAVCALALHALLQREWRGTLRAGGLYAAGVLPLLGVIAYDQLVRLQAAPPPGFPTADVIYAILRAPHHVSPFAGGHLGGTWAHQGAPFLFIAPAAVWLAWRGRSPRVRALAMLVAGLCVFFALALLASWFDRATGVLGKLYLFRPAALTVLLALLTAALAYAGRSGGLGPRVRRTGQALALLLIAYALAFQGAKALRATRHWHEVPFGLDVAAIRAATGPDDVVLLEPYGETSALPRLLDRGTLVDWKLIPTNPADIYRWWGYMTWTQRVFAEGCGAAGDPPVPVAWLLALQPETAARLSDCGPAVWSDGRSTLIRAEAWGAAVR